MRKFGFGVLCCVAAAAFLGGCNKNEDMCCGGDCKDKAAVKMDAGATPASDASCASKCKSQCTGDKAAVKTEGDAVPATDGSCAAKKSGCCKSKQAQ